MTNTETVYFVAAGIFGLSLIGIPVAMIMMLAADELFKTK